MKERERKKKGDRKREKEKGREIYHLIVLYQGLERQEVTVKNSMRLHLQKSGQCNTKVNRIALHVNIPYGYQRQGLFSDLVSIKNREIRERERERVICLPLNIYNTGTRLDEC